MTQTVTGTIHALSRFNSTGDLLYSSNVYADFKTTFTSLSTGESVTSVRGALERRTISDDGRFVTFLSSAVL